MMMWQIYITNSIVTQYEAETCLQLCKIQIYLLNFVFNLLSTKTALSHNLMSPCSLVMGLNCKQSAKLRVDMQSQWKVATKMQIGHGLHLHKLNAACLWEQYSEI